METNGGISYQPLTHLLRQRLERENAPDDLLSDLRLTQLTRILPELRDRYPDLPEPIQEEATARQHLFEAITRLGQALAERAPLVLFIDDWHWPDAASLDVLHYAALRWSEIEQVPKEVAIIGDAGFDGLQNYHPERRIGTPHKARRNHLLTPDQKLTNREFSSVRIVVENTLS